MAGTWTDEKVRDEAVATIQELVKGMGVENALIDAIPCSLKRRPAQRGMFDAMTAESVKKVFAEKIDALKADLDPSRQAALEEKLLEAQRTLEGCQKSVVLLTDQLEAAKAKCKITSGPYRLTCNAVNKQRKSTEAATEVQEECHQRLTNLEETVAIVEGLIVGKPPADGVAEMEVAEDAGVALESAAEDVAPAAESSEAAQESAEPQDAEPAAEKLETAHEVADQEVSMEAPQEAAGEAPPQQEAQEAPRETAQEAAQDCSQEQAKEEGAEPQSPRAHAAAKMAASPGPRMPPTPQRKSRGGTGSTPRSCTSPLGTEAVDTASMLD